MKPARAQGARCVLHARVAFFLLSAALAACQKGGDYVSPPANAPAAPASAPPVASASASPAAPADTPPAAASVREAPSGSAKSEPATVPCDLAQIAVARLEDDESAGHGEHRFSVKNTSRIACSLPRYPIVRLLGADAKPLGVKVGLTHSQGEHGGSVVLAPGQAAWFALGYAHRGTTTAPACAGVPKIGVGLTGTAVRTFDLKGQACPHAEGKEPSFDVTPFAAGSP